MYACVLQCYRVVSIQHFGGKCSRTERSKNKLQSCTVQRGVDLDPTTFTFGELSLNPLFFIPDRIIYLQYNKYCMRRWKIKFIAFLFGYEWKMQKFMSGFRCQIESSSSQFLEMCRGGTYRFKVRIKGGWWFGHVSKTNWMLLRKAKER